MGLEFTKMHGLGNDFVVIDATRSPFRPSRELAARLADRRRGVGCDQILVLEPAADAEADFGYRIYNADGSESGQCGNGARCLARYIVDHRLSDKRSLRVRTTSGSLELQLLDDGQVRVNMGVPRWEPREIPFEAPARALRYPLRLDGVPAADMGAVNLGNPHAVIEVADVANADVAAIGRALQVQGTFPEGVNVGFLQVRDTARASLRVFERGVGETLACGSGACAAVAVGRSWGKLGPRVAVELPGGMLHIEWDGEGHPVWMTGPAETVYTGALEGEGEWESAAQQ